MTEVLGPALVAGALGRKLGDARTATLIKGITECRVEIMSTRQKAKRPVPKAPDNSREADSSVERADLCDARMSLSATNLQVRLELPGDVAEENERATEPSGAKGMVVREVASETVSAEPRRVFLTSVQANSSETPICNEIAREIGMEDAPAATTASVHESDKPAAPRLIGTPVVTGAETRIDVCARRTPKTPMLAVEVEGTASGAK